MKSRNSSKTKISKPDRIAILDQLITIFNDLKNYRPDFHSSTISIKQNGRWPGISIQTLEEHCSLTDLKILDQAYQNLTKWSADESTRSNIHAATLDNGTEYKITARIDATRLASTLHVDSGLIEKMNYRQRLMMNDIAFDIIQSRIGNSQDKKYRDAVTKFVGSAINTYLGAAEIGFAKAGNFDTAQSARDALILMKLELSSRKTNKPTMKHSTSHSGLFRKVSKATIKKVKSVGKVTRSPRSP